MFSSLCKSLIKTLFFKTPNATAESGNKSRTSNIHGTRFNHPNIMPMQPNGNGGDETTMTSISRIKIPLTKTQKIKFIWLNLLNKIL